jgi:hypothetical protein
MHLRHSAWWPVLLVVACCPLGACASGQARASRRPPPVSGIAESSAVVAITSHSAYWASVFGIGTVDGECVQGAGLLVIRGELHNGAELPLEHVKLSYELLDADGRVVAAEEGYNRNSEMLRPLDSPIPWVVHDPPQLPIPKGGADSFRMLFLRSETPPFASYRIRVVESAAR